MRPINKIILSVSNDLYTDQRLAKVCASLTREGYRPLLIGRRLKNSPKLPSASYEQYRGQLWFNSGPLFYINLNLFLFFKLLFTPCDLLISNDLDTLLANFLVSKIRRKPLIYDSHEYFTEVPELIHRPFVRSLWLKMEQFLIPRIRYAYTVGDHIRKAYKEKYGIEMKLVRNFPRKRNKTQIVKTGNYLLYQGALNVGRGLEELIEAMAFLPDLELKIAGSGDLGEDLREKVVKLNLGDRVKFLGRLHPEDLYPISQKAKLGLSLEHDLGLSYRYSLPNKIFDYLQAGIPVLYPDLPEIKQTLKPYHVGEVLESHAPEKIAAQIDSMLKSESYSRWREGALKAGQDLVWENEEKVLLKLISKIGN